MKRKLVILLTLGFFGASCSNDDDSNENCKEEEKEGCVVTFELNPVCGCNGVTYPNPSTAACNSIEDYSVGACE